MSLRGVAALAAVCDLEAVPALTRPGEPVFNLMGGTPADVLERYVLANPARRLPLGMPLLLVHGDADGTVPVRRSHQFAEKARTAGDVVEVVIVSGADHRAVADPLTPASPTVRSLSSLKQDRPKS